MTRRDLLLGRAMPDCPRAPEIPSARMPVFAGSVAGTKLAELNFASFESAGRI